eukprot:s537_g10.t1
MAKKSNRLLWWQAESDAALRLRYAAPTRLVMRRRPAHGGLGSPESPQFTDITPSATPRPGGVELRLDMWPLTARLLQGALTLSSCHGKLSVNTCKGFIHRSGRGSLCFERRRDKLGQALASALGPAELSDYFANGYLRGELFQGTQYSQDEVRELLTFRFDAADGPVHVWRTWWYYTHNLAFANVANLEQTAAQLFASLTDSRAHFGKGVYASQHEPCAWKQRSRVLLNSYSNESPFRTADDGEAQRVEREWGQESPANPAGHRAAFCVPMLVPRAMAYNIFERQTPDLAEKRVQDEATGEERPIRLGEDYKGRPVDRRRDVWVVRVSDGGGAVGHASAEADGVLRLLRLRLTRLREQLGDDHDDTFGCMDELGRRLYSRSQLDEAEGLWRQVLHRYRMKLGDDHPDTLVSINNLAALMVEKGDLEAAEPLYREALQGSRSKLGDEHLSTLASINNLAGLLQAKGDLQAAEPLLREVLDGSRVKLGDEHPQTLGSINNLAGLLQAKGDLKAAELLLREALDGSRAKLGHEHPQTLTPLYNLAALLEVKGDLEAAEQLYREAAEKRRARLGSSHADTLTSIFTLAKLLERTSQLDEAECLFREEFEQCLATYGAMHKEALFSASNLMRFLQERGDQAKLAEFMPDMRASCNYPAIWSCAALLLALSLGLGAFSVGLVGFLPPACGLLGLCTATRIAPSLRASRLSASAVPLFLSAVAAAAAGALHCQEDDPGISVRSWTPWAGAAVGLVAFVAAVAGHAFESDCLGYLLAHSSSALTGVLAALLAFLEARGDDAMDGSVALSEPSSWWNVWAKPADDVLSATSFATFLLLCTLGLTRAMLGLALWPYAQRLRRPAVAKTLLQSAGTPRASSSTQPALTEQEEPPTSPKPRRARKALPIGSGRALEPSPDEAIAAVEDDLQPSPTAAVFKQENNVQELHVILTA